MAMEAVFISIWFLSNFNMLLCIDYSGAFETQSRQSL